MRRIAHLTRTWSGTNSTSGILFHSYEADASGKYVVFYWFADFAAGCVPGYFVRSTIPSIFADLAAAKQDKQFAASDESTAQVGTVSSVRE
jgi:hypothetical protein